MESSEKDKTSTRARAGQVAALVVATAVLAVCVWTGVGRVQGAQAAVTSAQSRLDAAQQSLSEAQSQAQANDSTAAVAAAQDLDSDQVSKDASTITQALTAALTWDSKASYDKAREDAVTAGLPADSDLMSKMMPEISDQTNQRDPTDVTNRIDQLGLNSEFDSADVRPWSKDGDSISYVVIAKADTRQGDADPATTTWLVRMTLDKGTITSADAQPMGITTNGQS